MPTKLLIDESPLLVLPSLAAKIGLEEGIFLQQLHYWIEKSGHDRDGRRWIFNTYDDWSTQFTWWSIQSIRRIVNSLRQQGIIETTTAYNTIKIDKTLWYCICYDTLAILLNNAPPPAPSEPSEPSDPPPAAPTTVEINSPSVEINSPSVESNAPRVENNSPRVEIDTPITSRSLQETTAEDLVVVVDDDLPQDPIALEEKTRARARATPLFAALTYDQAITNPAAIDQALLTAGILSPDTRAAIRRAAPHFTVADILDWDAQRTHDNNGIPPARQMGRGALAALLRTGQRPPPAAHDPARTERWLITHGYLPADPPDPGYTQPHPPIPADPPIPHLPPPDPAADALWTPVLSELSLSLQRPVFDNWLRHTSPTAYDPATQTLTVTVPTAAAQDWLSQRMAGMLKLRLQRIAGHPIHPIFQLPGPAP